MLLSQNSIEDTSLCGEGKRAVYEGGAVRRLKKPPRKGGETGTVLKALALAVGSSTWYGSCDLAMLQCYTNITPAASWTWKMLRRTAGGPALRPVPQGSCTCKATLRERTHSWDACKIGTRCGRLSLLETHRGMTSRSTLPRSTETRA